MSFPAPVSFNGVQFDIVDRNGTPWLQAGQVSRALGYSQEDAITKVYSRNSDEFTPDMTETVKLGVSGNLQKTVRIFSPRGCHLLGMFASTPKAKEFRRWVLDVLDGKVEAPKQRTAAPVNSTKGQAVAQIILSQTGRFRFSEIQHQLPAAHRRRLPFILYSLMHSGLINRVAHGSYEVVGASPHHQESDTLEAAFMVRSMAKAVDAALSEFRDKIFNMEQTLKLVDSGRMSLVLNARN